MIASVLGAIALVLVLAGGRLLRPPPARVRALAPGPRPWQPPTIRRRRGRAATVVADGAPEIASGLVLAVRAGLTPVLALLALADSASGPLGDALTEMQRRWRAGARFTDALAALDDVPGAPLAPIVRALRDSERDGTPLVPALDEAARALRDARRRRAEAAARRAPIVLLFPLVLCVLPAFVLLTVVPLLVTATASLRL